MVRTMFDVQNPFVWSQKLGYSRSITKRWTWLSPFDKMVLDPSLILGKLVFVWKIQYPSNISVSSPYQNLTTFRQQSSQSGTEIDIQNLKTFDRSFKRATAINLDQLPNKL